MCNIQTDLSNGPSDKKGKGNEQIIHKEKIIRGQ
jgi:hypothetical protein